MANEIEISTGNHKLDIVLNDLPLGLKQHSIRARDKAKELAEIQFTVCKIVTIISVIKCNGYNLANLFMKNSFPETLLSIDKYT